MLVLRSDMTIPIARVVSTRYAHAEPPLRFCYVAHAYRSVRPQRGQDREMLQAGIELVGGDAPEGTAEAIAVLCAALDAAGLEGYRIGLGDASLYPALLDAHGVPAGGARADPPRAGHARLRRAGARGRGPRARRRRRARRSSACPSGAAGRRCSRASARRATGCARCCELLRAGGRRAGHPRPRARAPARLLHGRDLRGLRRRARRPARRRRALRRPARPLRARAARGRLGAQRRAAAHRAAWGSGGGERVGA